MQTVTRQSESTIMARLERLETQNRRMKRVGFAALLVSGAVFWMGQARVNVSKDVESRKFTLMDVKGKKRAELGVTVGRPALLFYDSMDQVSVSVGIDEEGPGLVIYGPNEQRQAALSLTDNGPVLKLHAANGTTRMNLSVTSQGPAIGLLGANGEAKGAFGMTANQDAFLQLFGTAEHGGAQLFAAPDRAVLRFFDASDQPRAVLGMLEKEGAGLTLNDAAANVRATLMLTPTGVGLDFRDQNKAVVWHAP